MTTAMVAMDQKCNGFNASLFRVHFIKFPYESEEYDVVKSHLIQ